MSAPSTPLPLELRRFLTDRVRSIEALEALILLKREPSRSWSERELADALGIAVELVHERVAELASEQLVSVGAETPATYRFHAADPALDRLVAQLATVYSTQRVDVLVYMATSAMDRVRSSALHTFSEAFRVHGPKKNG
jgi:predicted transcriptional regulator